MPLRDALFITREAFCAVVFSCLSSRVQTIVTAESCAVPAIATNRPAVTPAPGSSPFLYLVSLYPNRIAGCVFREQWSAIL